MCREAMTYEQKKAADVASALGLVHDRNARELLEELVREVIQEMEMTTPRLCAECKKRTFHVYCVGEDNGTAAWVYTCVRCGTQHSSEMRADDPFDAATSPSAGLEATSSSREGLELKSESLGGLDAATVEAWRGALEVIGSRGRIQPWACVRHGSLLNEADVTVWKCWACGNSYDKKPADDLCENDACDTVIARRALATPPGQANEKETTMSIRHILERLRPKPRVTVKRFAAELDARLSKVKVAFTKPGQEQFTSAIDYAKGVLATLLSDYDTRDPEDYMQPPTGQTKP